MDVVQLAALGVGLGGVYAILALGVIAIYRGTGHPELRAGRGRDIFHDHGGTEQTNRDAHK